MKNQREIYEALLAGETLKCGGSLVSFNDNGIQVDGENRMIGSPWRFDYPQDWSIYEKPKVLTKFYKYLYPNGELTEHFYTGDLKLRFRGRADEIVHKSVFTSTEGTMLLRTSLYIEIEV